MNLEKWNKLPASVQKELIDTTAAFEPKMVKFFQEEETKEWAELDKLVTRVKFSDADDKRFLDTAYEIEWSTLAKRVTPEMLMQRRKVTGN